MCLTNVHIFICCFLFLEGFGVLFRQNDECFAMLGNDNLSIIAYSPGLKCYIQTVIKVSKYSGRKIVIKYEAWLERHQNATSEDLCNRPHKQNPFVRMAKKFPLIGLTSYLTLYFFANVGKQQKFVANFYSAGRPRQLIFPVNVNANFSFCRNLMYDSFTYYFFIWNYPNY